jgi:ABC-2 type transport system ATP-binding protein
MGTTNAESKLNRWFAFDIRNFCRMLNLIIGPVELAFTIRDSKMFDDNLKLEPDTSAPPLKDRAEQSALVQIDGVRKSFGHKIALKNVTFSVPSGQICGLLGPNGAGKTTLFRLLMGILKATEGKLVIDGRDAFEERVEVKRLIGFLPDEPVFYSYLSGREVLELSAAMHGLDVIDAMHRIAPTIAQLRLAEDINNYAEDYSRGMKKKLGLLLGMLHEPKLLVLDEPTNGLDVESTHLFYDLISETAQRGTTVLFSTHLMDHVTKLCSHAVIINEGTVVAKGSLEELRSAFGQASLEEIFLKLTVRPPQA